MNPMKDLDGLLIVNKPVGPTSHDVVARARRALGTAKVGHTGTLDPGASGVLPLVLGRATRLAQFLTSDEKEYVATVRFGRTTDTYDAAGVVTSDSGRTPQPDALARALDAFRGTFEQTPPAHSAKKIGGVRAYALARRNADVTPGAVAVTVHRLELVRFEPPLAELRLTSSAGFYVRSLAHDLGARVGAGAILEGLVRVRAGRFTLDEAVPFETLTPGERDRVVADVRPMATLLAHLPSAMLTETGVRRVRQGQDVGPEHMLSRPTALVTGDAGVSASPTALYDAAGQLVGVGKSAGALGFLHAAVVLG